MTAVSRRRRTGRFAFAVAASALMSPAAAQVAGPRTEVAIRQVRLSDGVVRYAIPIVVGGRLVLAGLDTGSTGLRLLPAAQSGLQPTPRQAHETYGSGVQLDGPIALGRVAIGARAGTIGVHQIDAIGCTREPCGADLGLDAFRILGDGLRGEGFVAIIGIKPIADAAPRNPLMQLGVHRWIVSLPQPGSNAPGRLILDPDARDVAGFRPVPSGERPGQVRACLFRPTPQPARVCGPTVLDTGAPGLTVAGGGMPGVARPGAPARLIFGDPAAGAPAMTIRLDDPVQMTRFRVSPAPSASGVAIRAGVTPYLAYDVLYDADRGTVALRARPPFPGGPDAE